MPYLYEAKLRTAADIHRAKNLVYEQRIEGKVLSEQDKTWLDDYHEGIRSQQDAAMRATEVKKKSATANATGIMSMEVAVLRFSEDGTHGEMDIVLQQTTLSLVESHQQGSMTRAVETLLQCAQKNGSVWDVNKVSILRYRASSTVPTIVYQGGSPQYSNAKEVRLSIPMQLFSPVPTRTREFDLIMSCTSLSTNQQL